jgi:hypothetical protein
MWSVMTVASAALLVTGCIPSAWEPGEPHHTVSITIVGAVIAPARADGKTWDMDFTVSSAEQAAAANLLKMTNLEVALASYAVEAIVHEDSKPDPFGYVKTPGRVRVHKTPLPKQNNTFKPVWNLTIPHVVWSASTRVLVTLMDSDDHIMNNRDDEIGIDVSIPRVDLQAALADGKVHFVRTDDQTQSQLLFVSIVVTPENWSADDNPSS